MHVFNFLGLIIASILNLAVDAAVQQNHLQIVINQDDFKKYAKKKIKYDFSKAHIKLNNSDWLPVKLKTRGRNCLKAPRRCFSLKTDTALYFKDLDQDIKTKSFNLVSMWQDEGYVTSMLGHEFYRPLGLFIPKSTYVNVTLNNHAQGIYLMSEKGKSAIVKATQSPFVLRRNYLSRFEVKHNKDTNQLEQNIDQFNTVSNSISSFATDKEQFQYLSTYLDLNKYCRWLALNTLLGNGDYSDEVYFYLRPNNNGPMIFDIMAWDLDGLFSHPHKHIWNGLIYRRKLKKSLLYSMEIELDRVIYDNKYIYLYYLKTFKTLLLKQVNIDFIKNAFDDVLIQISPYLENVQNLKLSALDDRPNDAAKYYTKEGIEDLLVRRELSVQKRRLKLLKIIDQQIIKFKNI